MVSDYDEHYVGNNDIHHNESISNYTSVHSLHYGANLISFNILEDN